MRQEDTSKQPSEDDWWTTLRVILEIGSSIKFIINTSSDHIIVDQAEIAYENTLKLAQILERILTTDNVVRNNKED